MTYFDLQDPDEAQSALISARLNFWDARRFLQEGSLRTGMFALYDSVLFAMYHYVVRHEANVTMDLCDGTGLFHKLVLAGVFEDPGAFDRLSLTIERALGQRPFSFNANEVLAEVEIMLTKLGILPTHESTLPPWVWMSVTPKSNLIID